MGDVTAAWLKAKETGDHCGPPLPLVRLSSCLGARLWGLWAPLLWPFVNGMEIDSWDFGPAPGTVSATMTEQGEGGERPPVPHCLIHSWTI